MTAGWYFTGVDPTRITDGREYLWHGPDPAMAYSPPTTESETAMTNDNLPRVIEFEDIRPGDTIETSRKLKGITFTAQAVAAYLADEEWCTAEDGCITYRSEVRTIRLLDRPKPPLPTEGFIEAWGTPAHGKEEVHLLVAMLVGDGDWYGFTKDGRNSYLRPSQITRWRAVTVAPVDPTAPKADENAVVQELKRAAYTNGYNAAISAAKRADGELRERMQVLAGAFEASGNASGFDSATAAWHSAARKLRDALTETGADA